MGTILKLNRAEEHLHTIVDAVEAFGKSDFYETVTENDYKGRLIGRLKNVQEPPPQLSVLIGDCVFNYRSALDQIAYALASGHTVPLPWSWAKTSAFPIYNNGPQYRGRGTPPASRKLRGMSRGARANIERLQPYHRRNSPQLAALWMLEELSNIDKHRLIHLTSAVGVRSQFGIRGHGFMRMTGLEPLPVKIRNGAVAVRFYGEFDLEAGVEVEANIQPDIVFDRAGEAKSVRGRSVLRTLLEIREAIVETVFPTLQPEFARLFPGLTLGIDFAPEERTVVLAGT